MPDENIVVKWSDGAEVKVKKESFSQELSPLPAS